MNDIAYERYTEIRDLAWKTIIDNHVCTLPVSVMKIAKKNRITVQSYEQSTALLEQCGLQDHTTIQEAFVLYTDRWYILYSDNIQPPDSTRYCLARELARILLKHPLEHRQIGCFKAYYSNELLHKDLENEVQAFALRLLSPACVFWKITSMSAEKLVSLCGLPYDLAEKRWNRLQELMKQDKFLKHPLEAKVYHLFEPYIQSQQ